MTTHTTPDDQPLTPTPDTTRDLTELWEAMGEAGIRPKEIFISLVYDATHLRINIGGVDHGFDSELDPDSPWWQHALDILTGHAERWLRERGWSWFMEDNETCYEFWVRNKDAAPDEGDFRRTEFCSSLPAAIRAEYGRGK